MTSPGPDFGAVFEAVPGLYLVVEPDAPRYTVVATSDEYLRATGQKRKELLGRGLFEIRPPNVAEAESVDKEAMAASLERVVRTRTADAMDVRRHEVRSWRRLHSPVFGRDGALAYIIQRIEDVTDVEDAISKEATRFRELFESAPDGIFVAGPDGRYTDVNTAGCRLLDYTREELVGRSIVDFVAPDDRSRQAALKQHILEGGAETSEWNLRRKDGSYVPVELSINALPDGHLRAFVRDITARRRAEAALRSSEARLAGIVAIAADAIIVVDEMHHITMFNDGAEAIFGYSKDEVIGSPLDVLLPERLRAIHHEHLRKFAEERVGSRPMAVRADVFGRRKSGEEFPAAASIAKLDVGHERLLTVSLRDVSEQKRAEEAEQLVAEVGEILVAAGADVARMLTDVAHAIVRKHADWCSVDIVHEQAVRRLRVVHSDPAMAPIAAALERYPARRDVPSPLFDVVDTHEAFLMTDVSPDYLASIAQNVEHLELMRAFDPGSVIVVPLVARGQTLGALTLGTKRASRRYGARDIRLVERVATRVALAVDNARLHEVLAAAIRARDEVLGVVAHDLRNPLNSILLATQLPRAPGSPPPDDDSVDRIRRAALRMNRLIQDLLDVSRLEAGQRLSINPESVSTASVLDEVIEQQKATSDAANRTLIVDAERAPASLWVDRHRLLQVLDNLVGNAIKFGRHTIRLAVAAGDGEVQFSVADDGMGVSAVDVPRLFDRYWQAGKEDHRGAGLGLSIVKAIVDAHGGRVWVESDVGAGTIIHFALPARG